MYYRILNQSEDNLCLVSRVYKHDVELTTQTSNFRLSTSVDNNDKNFGTVYFISGKDAGSNLEVRLASFETAEERDKCFKTLVEQFRSSPDKVALIR